MKFSIITPTLDSEKSISFSLNSVFNQVYKNFEHIVVDGGSSDNTIKIVKKHKVRKKIIIKKKSSIYAAINEGIKNAKGEYIIVLNSDDIFNSNLVLKKIAKRISKSKEKILLGNVCYHNNFAYKKVVRFYSSNNFKPWMMFFGLMPPHTGSIIHKNIFKNYGYYNEKFSIAGDFEFFLRLFVKHKIKHSNLNFSVARMRTGGVSGENIFAHIKSSNEILKSFKINDVSSNIIFVYLRFLAKIHQLFLFDEKKLIKNSDSILTNIMSKLENMILK